MTQQTQGNGNDSGDPGQAAQADQSSTPSGQSPPAGTDGPRTFSQDEVNQMMGRVRQEERGKFGDYDDMKTKAAKLTELEQAQMTETEKLRAENEKAKADVAAATQRATETAIRSEIRVKAAQLGIVDPDAAYLLADRSNVQYQEDGAVSGVDEALTALLEAKPYLKGHRPEAPNLNGGSGGPPATGGVKLDDLQRQVAHKMYPNLPPAKAEEEYAAGIAR
jgi:hypothetical protein